MREVVTLQFGNYSNHVGAHFWNVEDGMAGYDAVGNQEMDPDVTWRTVETGKTLSAYPRLLAFDLTGALGMLGTEDEIDEVVSSPLDSWEGALNVSRAASSKKHPHQQALDEQKAKEVEIECPECGTALPPTSRFCNGCGAKLEPREEEEEEEEELGAKDNTEVTRAFDGSVVQYWPDYLTPRLHQRNTFQLTGLHHQVNKFNYYTQGYELMEAGGQGADQVEDMLDKFRWTVEQCDSLQGIHCVFDVDSGFAGITSKFLQELRDGDFASTPIVSFGCDAPEQPSVSEPAALKQRARRVINKSVALWDVSQLSNVYVPLARPRQPGFGHFQGFTYDEVSLYESSALLGASIHTATLPYRMKDNSASMRAMCQGLVARPRVNMPSWRVLMPVAGDEPVLQPGLSDEQKHLYIHERQGGSGYGADYTMRGLGDAKTKEEPSAPLHLSDRMSLITGIDDHRDKSLIKEQMSLLTEYTMLEGVASEALSAVDRPNQIRQNLQKNLELGVSCYKRFSSTSNNATVVPFTFPAIFPEEAMSRAENMATLSYMYINGNMHKGVHGFSREFCDTRRQQSAVHQFQKYGLTGDDWDEVSEGLMSLAQDYRFAD